MFEQSGTFKQEFIKLGIPAIDLDIQNNFGQTDMQIDLFEQIEKAYTHTHTQSAEHTIFDDITEDDLIMAFFPCIYFECLSMMAFNWGCTNYKKLDYPEKTDKIIEREQNRTKFYTLLLKFVRVVMAKKIRMILENPYSLQNFLKQGNFVKNPDVIDNNRMMRGDYFVKPTAYWYFNCEPTYGRSYQNDKEQKAVIFSLNPKVKAAKGSKQAGLCSEERSMISPDYARNFICDFILGNEQKLTQLSLF